MKPKPLFGDPCNRCGRCCVSSQCPVSLIVFGRGALPCPALKFDLAGNSSCGMLDPEVVTDPDARAAIEVGIGSGIGCDAVAGKADELVHDLRWPAMRDLGLANVETLSDRAVMLVDNLRELRRLLKV